MRDKLIALLEPELGKLGYELVELEFSGRGAGGTLRLYMDKPGGIRLDDCEQVSRRVSAVLDVEDPIPGSYRLEVSSPGSDRPLRTEAHYREQLGQCVNFRMTRPIKGRRKLSGSLKEVGDGFVLVEVDGSEWTLPLVDVERARLKPES